MTWRSWSVADARPRWPSRSSTSGRTRRPARLAGQLLAVLAALGQVPPACLGHVHPVLLRGGQYPLPCPVPLGVADALNLVEARDRVPDMPGVGERLLALLGESEVLVRQPVLLSRAQAFGLAGHLRPVCPRALHSAGLGDIALGSFLLSRGGHAASSDAGPGLSHAAPTRYGPAHAVCLGQSHRVGQLITGGDRYDMGARQR